MSKANSPRAQALAAVVLKLTQALRSGFPVEGEPWLAAGEDPNVAQHPMMDVLPRLVDPWYPLRPAEGRRRADPTPDDPPALGELLGLLKQLFDFYGWELLITGRLLRRQRWHWPEVPPLPRKLLADLERVACGLASPGQGGVEVKPAAETGPQKPQPAPSLPLPADAGSPAQETADGEINGEPSHIVILRDRAAREYAATGGRFWLAAFPADLELGRCSEHDSACGTVVEGRVALPLGCLKYLGGANLEGRGAFALVTFTVVGSQPPEEWQRFLSFAADACAALVAHPAAWARSVSRMGNPAETWIACLLFVCPAAAPYVVEKPGGCRLITQPWAASSAALRAWHTPVAAQADQDAAAPPDTPSTEATPATLPAEALPPESGDSTPEIDLEAQALALLFQHPDWSILQITNHLKVERRTPYKWPKFRRAAELAGRLKPRGPKDRTPHQGHKTDGRVEAYAPENENDEDD